MWALEELGVNYEHNPMPTTDAKSPGHLKLNPNGHVPVLEDDGVVIWESMAINLYLAEKYGRFLPADVKGRSTAIQWLMFQMGGIGPMQGQANVFFRYWHEKYQPAIDRYQNETKRLYRVLETRLQGREFLCDEYGIADIANFTWVNIHSWSGVPIDDLPNVQAWRSRIRERPAVQRGLAVPGDSAPAAVVDAARTILQR